MLRCFPLPLPDFKPWGQAHPELLPTPLLPSGFSHPSSFGCGYKMVLGGEISQHPNWKLDSRLWILGLVWGWLGWTRVISTMAYTPTVFPACDEPGNPKPWTNLVSPHFQHAHGPAELSRSPFLSPCLWSWLSCLSQRPQRVSKQSGERGNFGPVLPLVGRLRYA